MEWTAWGLEREGDSASEADLLISAQPSDQAKRAPVMLNLVLDCSASMQGAPMAAAIEACQQLVVRTTTSGEDQS